jgi:hypothetical protein
MHALDRSMSSELLQLMSPEQQVFVSAERRGDLSLAAGSERGCLTLRV